MGRNLIALVSKTCGNRQADPPCRPFRSSERPRGPRSTGKPTIPGLVQTFRGPKHHEPARPPCPQSSGICGQGLAGSRGPRAQREQPVVSLARSGAEAQTGHRDIDPAFPWGPFPCVSLCVSLGQTDLEFIVEKILNRSDPGATDPGATGAWKGTERLPEEIGPLN